MGGGFGGVPSSINWSCVATQLARTCYSGPATCFRNKAEMVDIPLPGNTILSCVVPCIDIG